MKRPQGRPREEEGLYHSSLLGMLWCLPGGAGGGGSGEDGPGILSDIAAPTIRALIRRAKWRKNRPDLMKSQLSQCPHLSSSQRRMANSSGQVSVLSSQAWQVCRQQFCHSVDFDKLLHKLFLCSHITN